MLAGTKIAATLPIPQNVQNLKLASDQAEVLLSVDYKPEWASGMGRDCYGLWAEFLLEKQQGEAVIQRMRWIPPGQFMMGSPEDEPGRWEDEGPEHSVVISKGYWLFDTPVTQALWVAVMGENPSEFQSSMRPVEQVSWDDSRTFIDKLNGLKVGLELSLPSEAQWEYACRAGSETALYSGEIEIMGEHNAPALDAIAWYGGNSGHEFDLEKGWDSSSWDEKQYTHTQAGTRTVGLKAPNGWGLYDMIGNVWEWCEDGKGEYSSEAVKNPLRPGGAGAERVIRGGSWSREARSCRAACRLWGDPGVRSISLGFRPARVQE